MELSTAIEKALDGNAVLFVGAGFSRGAVNIKGNNLPFGHELAAHFASLCALPENTSLEDAAEVYVEKFSTDALIQEIQSGFTVKEVKPFHRHIATLPWKQIYTTNYDNVLEIAYSLEGKRLTPVTIGTNIYKLSKTDTLCVHLNGYVDRLDRTKIGSELKLTEVSYLTESIVQSQWANSFRMSLRQAQSVFFLGYSLYDLDIKRLLVETDNLKDKSFFILGETPDAQIERRALRFGTVLKQSVEQFSQAVYEIQKKYTPVKIEGVATLAIKEYSATIAPEKISDKDFLDLLMYGKRSQGLICESLRTGQKYFLERNRTNEVFDLINRGHRVIVICANLGNGKSLFLEGLRQRALEKGFRVFSVREQGDSTNSELEAIAKLQDKTLTIIEEYYNWLDEIRLFRLNASPSAVLVVTARNAINDVVIDDLAEVSGEEKSLPEISLDKLQTEEIDWFIKTLDTYGYWGEKAGLSQSAKAQFIKQDCQGQTHAILLKLLSSPNIGGKIQKLAKELRADSINYKLLLSVHVLTILNYNVDTDILTDIWGIESVSRNEFRRSQIVGEFIDFKSGEVSVKSAIVAEYILQNTSDAATIVKVLITIIECAHKLRTNPAYYSLFKDLMRHSNLQLILPEDNRKNAVIRFYEEAKNLEKCKNNPLFWLQYAIASLVNGDLKRSKLYFDTAYSLATKIDNYNTYQIDNHYARFLLVQALELEHKDAMTNFREARTIIKQQLRFERRHYTYRVATFFKGFMDLFEDSLSVAELGEVVQIANEVLKRIAKLPEGRRKHYNVVDCEKAMRYIAERGAEIISAKKESN